MYLIPLESSYLGHSALELRVIKNNLTDLGLLPKVFAFPKGQFKPKAKIFQPAFFSTCSFVIPTL